MTNQRLWQDIEAADCCLADIKAFRVVDATVNHCIKYRDSARGDCALTYVLEGGYFYTPEQGDEFVCRRGEMSWLPFDSRYYHYNERPARMYVIYFRLLKPDGSEYIPAPPMDEASKLTCRSPERFERLFADVINRFFSVIPSPSEVKAALYRLLGALAREEASMRLTEWELARIAPAIERLGAGTSERLGFYTVGELAKSCCMSEYAFRELFKKYAGVTPKAYLDERRIEQVEALLANADMSITDAAAACGFDDPSYFFKMYKRLRGRTPKCGSE